jgi:hypothetical protein
VSDEVCALTLQNNVLAPLLLQVIADGKACLATTDDNGIDLEV